MCFDGIILIKMGVLWHQRLVKDIKDTVHKLDTLRQMELMETIDVYNFKTDLVYLPLLSQVFCEHLGHMSVWELFWCFEWTCHEIVVRHNCKTFTLLNLSRALPASWHHCSFTRGVLIILNMFRSRVCYCILFFEVQPPCTL